LLGGVLIAGLLGGIVPAWQACRLSLADGLTPRL
jgi:putative ABC transport system permease protein